MGIKEYFDLDENDIKRVNATIGLLIMIMLYVIFAIIGYSLTKMEFDPIIITILLIGLGQIYGGIGVIIQILFRTKAEDIPPVPPLLETEGIIDANATD